ncbi:methylated-DNA--[protein]-cysteine S-methyltransferase [bacterium]|nr:methylated-DNA--[protein]-cysteine S-methyltransferase [bacterium]
MGYRFNRMQSPVGELKLITGDNGLAAILWEQDAPQRVPHVQAAREDRHHPLLLQAEAQLKEYFAGERKAFDLPLDFTGNEFSRRVWNALLAIPYGETRSYGQIARQMGQPNSARAVGMANSRNPISIVAPCHRVIGANGRLTGFAGGLKAKAYLLELESCRA